MGIGRFENADWKHLIVYRRNSLFLLVILRVASEEGKSSEGVTSKIFLTSSFYIPFIILSSLICAFVIFQTRGGNLASFSVILIDVWSN
jgi:hypothetical protein